MCVFNVTLGVEGSLTVISLSKYIPQSDPPVPPDLGYQLLADAELLTNELDLDTQRMRGKHTSKYK